MKKEGSVSGKPFREGENGSVKPDKGSAHEKPFWQGKHFSFFQNRECEYFPCHRTNDVEGFNCLFCYCPLYALGEKCGGDFRYTEKGIKDCTGCVIPHKKENYGRITGACSKILDAVRKIDRQISVHESEIMIN